MTIEISILSIFFFVIFNYSFLKRNLVFEVKWDLLKKFFLIGHSFYFFFFDIHLGFKLAIINIFVMNMLILWLFENKKVIGLLNFISMLGVIVSINYYLGQGISQQSYIAVSYLFAAFFISFFDIVMNFRSQIFMKIIFLILANLLAFQVVFSAIRMS